MAQKTALSVQSLACHGKCSLTEALPIISANGISLSVLPTVMLSTHTGGFGIPERLNVSDFFYNTLKHFKKESVGFDGIYTGYFASAEQIDIFAEEIFNFKNENAIVLVDPVLGNNGKLFDGLSENFAESMLKLCKLADVITPNLTEAQLLCGESYRVNLGEKDIISLSLKLYDLTKACVIIPGNENKNKIGASVFDGEKIKFIHTKKQNGHFHGTGDIFSSIVFARLLKGSSVENAVNKAVCFISKTIKKTVSAERDGLEFERF